MGRKVWISIDSNERFEPNWNLKPIARLPHDQNEFIQLDAECNDDGMITYNGSDVIDLQSLRQWSSEDPKAEYYAVYCSSTSGEGIWHRSPVVIDGVSLQDFLLAVFVDDPTTGNGHRSLTWIYPWHQKEPHTGWKWIQRKSIVMPLLFDHKLIGKSKVALFANFEK